MGAACCCGEEEKPTPQAPPPKAPSERKPSEKKSSVNAGPPGEETPGEPQEKPKKESMVFHSEGGDDAEKFDAAFRGNNIESLIALMDSNEKIETDEQMHQWAKNPRTIGALAGTQLAIKGAVTAESATELQPYDPEMKNKIRTMGGITKFVDFLNSGQEDRIHTAVVALSFLCIESPLNAQAAFDAGAMTPLVPLMLSPVEGLACAAASILRNIILEDDIAKQKLCSLGGVEGFVKLLELPKGYKDLGTEDLQRMLDLKLEALLTICEFMEEPTEERRIVREYAKLVHDAGAREKIKALFQFNDRELEDVADDILQSIEEAGH
ncbi:unnamed protein product [Amoebophrya sp. A120]|nr:unnamed protein product [Amoebophrya sp. A120]|eukprot:GSA120T00010768001.1